MKNNISYEEAQRCGDLKEYDDKEDEEEET